MDIESTKLIPAENVNRIAVRHLFYELQDVELIGQVKAPGRSCRVYRYPAAELFTNLTLCCY